MSRHDLNPEQMAAATHGIGPALVLAGPGTGKTTTLVERYAHLTNAGASPERVFVSTFTRKAAQELRNRIHRATGVNPRELPIGTFHSYCFSLTGAPDVIEAPRRFSIVRECMPDWKGDLSTVVDAIDCFKDALVSPEEAQSQARQAERKDRDELQKIASAYACYQQRLSQDGLVDFGDLVWQSIRLLRDRPSEATRFEHLLIDEYQDINPAQDALINGLLDQGGQLWVVGDDDQAIYGWRGSDVRYITSFTRTYAGATTYQLKRNYRSSELIVNVAQALVSHNKRRLSKTLVAAAGVTSRRVCLTRCDTEEHEAKWIATAVRKLIGSGVPPQEIAILLRTNFQTVEFERALSREKIKFVIRGTGSFWNLPVVRALMSAIWRTISPTGRAPWAGPGYLVEILDSVAGTAGGVSFNTLVDKLVAEAISVRPSAMAPEQRIQWDGGAKRLGDESHGFSDAGTFLAHCRKSSGRGTRADDEEEAVVLSTIHQAKGLEWQAIFVAGCEDELLPHRSATDQEEERRLLYVAVTRAKAFLTLTWAADRGGTKRSQSPFLAELCVGADETQLDRRGHSVEHGQACGGRENEQGPSLKPKKNSAKVPRSKQGKSAIRVKHAKFGDGTVKSTRSDKYVVQFDQVGEKTILRSYLVILG
jgi:DNA helicase-2/ATP-dependent DNA helicase PcrA